MTADQQTAGKTIAQEVTTVLVNDIVTGVLPQGSKISEPDLSRRYQVGRGPLREAILRLEGMGLVVRAAHIGARVVTLTPADLSDIFSLREALEGMAARLAAESMSQHELDDLEQLLDKHADYLHRHDGQEYIEQQGEYDFHYRVIQGSDNQRLIQSLCNELYHLVRLYRHSSGRKGRPEQALDEHRMILKALQDRDGELAEMLMRRHIARSRKAIEQALGSGLA
ncbi:GntR family transcriptional regulator [Endozoicomonas montiporae]|uniref:GntR family transcriptional regulator n=1 Tax=Endozoicomonas montiporae TaxID=1027273 RepID=UPI001F30EBA3|nr:GntR family transcriptional regulator [Endozoicomonas montiporae]